MGQVQTQTKTNLFIRLRFYHAKATAIESERKSAVKLELRKIDCQSFFLSLSVVLCKVRFRNKYTYIFDARKLLLRLVNCANFFGGIFSQ